MGFLFSNIIFSGWYVVAAFLIVVVIALIVTVILMDKKDKAIITEYIKEHIDNEKIETINDNISNITVDK